MVSVMSKPKPIVVLLGSLLTALCGAWALWVTFESPLRQALTLLWSACAVAVAVWFVYRTVPSRRLWWFVWIVAIGARVALWWSPPVLSDDVYRYLWDGRVALAGISPYRYAPSDPRLDLPRDGDWANINHKEIPTIYPPLSQMLFAALTWIQPSIWTFKAAFALFDVLIGLMLLVAAKRAARGPPRAALLLYLWHPLLLFEYAGSGHVDVLWALLFVACLIDIEAGRPGRALIWFAGAISAKLIAVAFVPLLITRIGWRRTALAVALAAATYAPYVDAGWNLWSGLQAYSLFWQFNGFIHALAVELPGGAVWSRPVIALTGLALAILIARRFVDTWRAVQMTCVVMMALLPVNYPWYWAILPATVVFRPTLPLHLLTLSLLLTYELLPRYYDTGTWYLSMGVRLVEAGLLLWSVVHLWRLRGQAGTSGAEPPIGDAT